MPGFKPVKIPGSNSGLNLSNLNLNLEKYQLLNLKKSQVWNLEKYQVFNLQIFVGLKLVVTSLEKFQVETEKLASQVHFKPVHKLFNLL